MKSDSASSRKCGPIGVANASSIALLGPPSQVIALDDETALYYLYERSEGEGLILIVYNRMRIDTRYDRAVFFFDENDVLTDFATKTYAHDE